MDLNYDKQILNNVVTSIIMFKAYGTGILTIDDEKNLVKNWNPTISYRDLMFKKYIKMVGNKPVEDIGVTNYTNTLSIVLPTSVIASPVTSGSENVTIGSKVVTINIADIITGIATSIEIETAILNVVKTEPSILALYSATDISVVGGHVVGVKTATTDSTSLVQTINTIFGANSVVMTSTSTHTGVLVELKLKNKTFVPDETLAEKFEIDANAIDTSLFNSVLTNKYMYSEAMAEVYRLTIKEAVEKKMEELRATINTFEGEETENI